LTAFNALLEGLKLILRHVRTKMWNTNVAHINIVPNAREALLALVQGQLVSPEVNIDPSTFLTITARTPQHLSVKRKCVG
jgi:hypothetical protein